MKWKTEKFNQLKHWRATIALKMRNKIKNLMILTKKKRRREFAHWNIIRY